MLGGALASDRCRRRPCGCARSARTTTWRAGRAARGNTSCVGERDHVGDAMQLRDAPRELERRAVLLLHDGARAAREAVERGADRHGEARGREDDDACRASARTSARHRAECALAAEQREDGDDSRAAHVANIVRTRDSISKSRASREIAPVTTRSVGRPCSARDVRPRDRHSERRQAVRRARRRAAISRSHVPRGTVYGLLGPNGAGKTTTIRMILNIIVPDSGTITLFGAAASHARASPTASATSPRSAACTRRCRCGACCASSPS